MLKRDAGATMIKQHINEAVLEVMMQENVKKLRTGVDWDVKN